MRHLRAVALIPLVACGTQDPWILRPTCEASDAILAPADVSALGFSGDEAVAWHGDVVTVTVDWFGRHSDTPSVDVITATLGPIEGDVVEQIHTPVGEGTAAECAQQNRVFVTRSASFATADGGVTGAGLFEMVLAALDPATAELSGSALVTVSASRQAEIDAAVPDHLPPPDEIALYVGRYATFDTAQIRAEGDGYTVAVWKCDEQNHPGCIDWE